MPPSGSAILRRPPSYRREANALASIIHERIAKRLGNRVRSLSVAIDRGVIRLSGQCSTFYTKQLAQHAVLGVVEDEVIDNDIVVSVPKPR